MKKWIITALAITGQLAAAEAGVVPPKWTALAIAIETASLKLASALEQGWGIAVVHPPAPAAPVLPPAVAPAAAAPPPTAPEPSS